MSTRTPLLRIRVCESSPRMVFTALGAVAELERSLIIRLRNARAKGKRIGRPRVALDARRIAVLRNRGASWAIVCQETGPTAMEPHSAPFMLPKTDLRYVCDRRRLTRLGHTLVSIDHGRTSPGRGGPSARSMRIQLIPSTPVRSPKTNEVVSQEMEAIPFPTMESGWEKPATDRLSTCTPSSLLLLMVTSVTVVPVF